MEHGKDVDGGGRRRPTRGCRPCRRVAQRVACEGMGLAATDHAQNKPEPKRQALTRLIMAVRTAFAARPRRVAVPHSESLLVHSTEPALHPRVRVEDRSCVEDLSSIFSFHFHTHQSWSRGPCRASSSFFFSCRCSYCCCSLALSLVRPSVRPCSPLQSLTPVLLRSFSLPFSPNNNQHPQPLGLESIGRFASRFPCFAERRDNNSTARWA